MNRTASHLQEVGESYTEHGKHALWIAWQCFVCVVALLVHAAYPDVLRKTASNRLDAIRCYRKRRTADKIVRYYSVDRKVSAAFPPNCS